MGMPEVARTVRWVLLKIIGAPGGGPARSPEAKLAAEAAGGWP